MRKYAIIVSSWLAIIVPACSHEPRIKMDPPIEPSIERRTSNKEFGLSHAVLQSDLMAAFVVAYDDYVALLRTHGETMDPIALRRTIGVVHLWHDNNQAEVSFQQNKPGFGGSLDYFIDLKTMTILERRQGR